MNCTKATSRLAIALFLSILLLLLLSSSLLGNNQADGNSKLSKRRTSIETLQYKPNEVIVKFRPSADKRRIERTISADSTSLRASENIQLLKLRPGVSVESAVKKLDSLPDVEYAEPNYIRKTFYTPSDPKYPNQYGLNNKGQTIGGTKGTPGADISAEEAWDIEKGSSSTTTVAVIDSGIDMSHPDLDSKVSNKGYNYAGISQWEAQYRWEFGDSDIDQVYAQSINGTGGSLTHVGILLDVEGSPTQQIVVSVRSTLNGSDLASYTIDPSEVSGVTEIYKALSNPVTLTAGVTYYLVFQTLSLDASNYYYLADAGNAYTEGYEYWGYGGDWYSFPDNDFYFTTNPNAIPHDDNGHGTHVSGIVAAESNNVGGVGVAFGNKTKILPLKIMDCNGYGDDSDLIESIYYAADNGADVINMSLGGPGKSQALQNAITYAYNTKNVVVVASSGNSGDSTMNYPAGCQYVIGVGSTNNLDKISSYSTHNSSVDVSAPGEKIYSTMPTYEVNINLYDYPMNYAYLSGTSMASPMVAGVAALFRSKNPSSTTKEVVDAIQANADDLGGKGRDDYYGYGRVNSAHTLSPQAPWGTVWLLPEGTTIPGFDEWVLLQNPTNQYATAELRFLTPNGIQNLTTVNVPPNSRCTVHVNEIISNTDVSVHVAVTNNVPICVERAVYVNTADGKWGSHDSIGTQVKSNIWYLAEGCTLEGYDEWVLVMNPNGKSSTIQVTFNTPSRQVAGPVITLEPWTRQTIHVNQYVPNDSVSTKIECLSKAEDSMVVAERSMYINTPDGKRGCNDSMGVWLTSSAWALPEGCTWPGFEEWVLLQNTTNSPVGANLVFLTPQGSVNGPSVAMAPNQRQSIRVNDFVAGNDVSTLVYTDGKSQEIAVERTMYINTSDGRRGSHNATGTALGDACWYLPEGCTLDGFDEWVLVMNPDPDYGVTVNVSFMSPTGVAGQTVESLPPGSRKTIHANDYAKDSISTKVQIIDSSAPNPMIMCERAMYINANGKNGATDSLGVESFWLDMPAGSGRSVSANEVNKKKAIRQKDDTKNILDRWKLK
jgi:subtilisin family serine protease